MHVATQARAHRQQQLPGVVLLATVLGAFPVLVLAWKNRLATPFFNLSADDFHRTLYAWQVSKGVLVPSNLWPPLPFWIEALALKVYPHVLSVPSLVNLAASTGALACLVLLGHTLGLRYPALVLLVLLAGSIPWYIWLSLSGLAEPIFIFWVVLAYLGVARWRVAERTAWLWIASLSLLAAGMVRFDGWGDSVVFSLGVCWLWWRAARPRPHLWLLAAAVPWIFPVIWMGWQYQQNGDPLFFSQSVRSYFLSTTGKLPLLKRLTWQPLDLWLSVGLPVPLGVIGLWVLRHRPGARFLAAMWFGSFALLVESTVTYVIAAHNTPRLVIVHGLLLVPPTVAALQQFARRGQIATLCVAVLVPALLSARVATLPLYSSYATEAMQQVGHSVRSARAEGKLRPSDRIMIEVHFWDYIPLHVLTDAPDLVVYDREPQLVITPKGELTLDDIANPSALAAPPKDIQNRLRHQRIHLVVAYTERAITSLRQFSNEILVAGSYHVFLIP